MDFDQPAQRFQRWLGCLDDHEVRAEVEAIDHELENLQRYRDLLTQALDLKQRWDSWFTSDAWQSCFYEDNQTPIASASVQQEEVTETDTTASDDSSGQVDEPQFAPNSLAARLARERLDPRWRVRARQSALQPQGLEHSASLG
jgi:hypothetical protein